MIDMVPVIPEIENSRQERSIMTKEQYKRLLRLRQSEETMLFMLIGTLAAAGIIPREVIQRTKINHKRAWYILRKWADRGYYAYGTSLDIGWLRVSYLPLSGV